MEYMTLTEYSEQAQTSYSYQCWRLLEECLVGITKKMEHITPRS